MQALQHTVATVLAEPTPAPGPANPLNGVKPDLGVLGGAFQQTWVKVAAATWAIMIAAASLYMGAALLQLANARKANNSYMMTDALGDVKMRGAALGGLVALPVIVGAIITVFS